VPVTLTLHYIEVIYSGLIVSEMTQVR